jgi:hypothetical protein
MRKVLAKFSSNFGKFFICVLPKFIFQKNPAREGGRYEFFLVFGWCSFIFSKNICQRRDELDVYCNLNLRERTQPISGLKGQCQEMNVF